MSGFAGVCRSAALVPLGLLLCLFVAVPALSYTGGPTRAHVAGLEPHEQRVYYYLTFHGGAWSKPEVWFFDLEGENPEKPIRAQSLEARDKDWWKDEHGISDAWRSLSSGFEPLTPLAQFNLEMSLCADSIAQDSPGGCPRYMGHLVLEGEGLGQAIDLKMFCQPMICVRGPYRIPGRPEAIAVVSYKGKEYGAEEVERPVLLVPMTDIGRGTPAVCGEARPATWNVPYHGRFGGQFVAYFGEVGASDHPTRWYLAKDCLTAVPPQVWTVRLEGSPPEQPISLVDPFEDSRESGWDIWTSVKRAGGRQTEIQCAEEFALNLHFVADSLGVDSTWDVPRYRGQLTARTQNGVGVVSFEMFCNTLVQVRGVYSLPERSELVMFVSYTANPSDCGELDLPIVIYSD
jgi:hypothetical protein